MKKITEIAAFLFLSSLVFASGAFLIQVRAALNLQAASVSGTAGTVTCGNGSIDSGEECEPGNLNGKTCNIFGYDGGTLRCTDQCVYDTSACQDSVINPVTNPACGNGILEVGEECDGSELRGRSCTYYGFDTGALSCNNCVFNLSACVHSTPADTVAPDTPIFNAVLKSRNPNVVRLTWEGSSDNVGVVSYIITREDEPSGTSGTLTTLLHNSNLSPTALYEWIDNTIPAGATRVKYSVRAKDAAGNLSSSNNKSVNLITTSSNCGNGFVDTGEECEFNDLRGKTCTDFGFDLGTLLCTNTCTIDTSACTNIQISATKCGNNLIEGSEQCDGTDLKGRDCTDFGFDIGTLSCSSTCNFNTSKCSTNTVINPVCGNSIRENQEDCDGIDLHGQTCKKFGFDGGTLACKPTCTFSLSGCSNDPSPPARCGNGIVESSEECDGSLLRGRSCTDFGFEGGSLSCSAFCTIDKNRCTSSSASTSTVCGNGIIESGEECDKTNLRGNDCVDLGFDAGTLSCNSDCKFNSRACTHVSVDIQQPPRDAVDERCRDKGITDRVECKNYLQSQSQANVIGQQGSTSSSSIEDDITIYCRKAGVTNKNKCRLLLSYDLPRECVNAGKLDPTTCENYLHERHIDEICSAENTNPGDECTDKVYDKQKDLIHCGELETAVCLSIAKERLQVQTTISARQLRDFSIAMDTAIGPHPTVQDVLTVIEKNNFSRDTFPLVANDTDKKLLVRNSDRTIDISNKITPKIVTPYLIFLDDDGDGLPNDVEALRGTDPQKADTDNDSFSDFIEIKNGFDPLTPAGDPVDHDLSPPEKALLAAIPIEQPITKGKASERYVVGEVTTPDTGGYVISGIADPNTVILVYIYSEMPLVLTMRTDEAGNWTYTLKDNLVDGKHTAYVAVTDDTGKIAEKSNPISFFVAEARAVTVSSFLEDQATTDTDQSFMRYYAIGGISIIVLGLAVFFLFQIRKKEHNV